MNLRSINWSSQNITKVEKNFYRETTEVRNMDAAEVDRVRKEKEISIMDGRAPNPIVRFEYAGFPRAVHDTLIAQGFTAPTAIQCQAWPIALSGKDLIGIADTGSGKTCAFLLPAIIHIQAQAPLQRMDGPIALVLAPTRELAMQIKVEAD